LRPVFKESATLDASHFFLIRANPRSSAANSAGSKFSTHFFKILSEQSQDSLNTTSLPRFYHPRIVVIDMASFNNNHQKGEKVMASTASLTELAASAGEAHNFIVQSLLRGSKTKTRRTPPAADKVLAQLRDAAKLSKKDADQLSQIVTLATGKSARPLAERLAEIQQIDATLQRKTTAVDPLVLTISSIANDSATTAMAMPAPRKNGKSKVLVKELIDGAAVVGADVLGALIGGALAIKAGKSKNVVVQVAVALGSAASASVRDGDGFPTNISVE
jgi:hypothetical protein